MLGLGGGQEEAKRKPWAGGRGREPTMESCGLAGAGVASFQVAKPRAGLGHQYTVSFCPDAAADRLFWERFRMRHPSAWMMKKYGERDHRFPKQNIHIPISGALEIK
jgi:hypothetical protein